MRLTTEEVRHIAALARIAMTDEEVQRVGDEMSQILDNFDVLDQVSTDGVEPTGHSVELKQRHARRRGGGLLARGGRAGQRSGPGG